MTKREPHFDYTRFNQLFKGWCEHQTGTNPYRSFRWVFDDINIRNGKKIKSTMVIGNYCSIRRIPDGYNGLWVDPTESVIEYIQKSMIPVSYDETYFSLIDDENEARVYVGHNKIICSRFLARIKLGSLPKLTAA